MQSVGTQLTSGLFYKDRAGRMDSVDLADNPLNIRRCGAEKRPRRSSLMILLLSRSNAGSVRRHRREGSVGPSEGRATDTRGRRG